MWFDLATVRGDLGAYLSLAGGPAGSAFEAALVGEGRPLVSVVDHDGPPLRGPTLEVRTEGLWAAVEEEDPGTRWSVGLEAFGVALDDPEEAFGRAFGDRTALGFDLEWEAEADGPGGRLGCRVHGEVLVGRERLAVDGWGMAATTLPPGGWAWARTDDGAWTWDQATDGAGLAAPVRRGAARVWRALGRGPAGVGWSEQNPLGTAPGASLPS